MKFAVTYGRKVPLGQYDMVDIKLYREFDEKTPLDEAYAMVKGDVERWITAEITLPSSSTPAPLATPSPAPQEELPSLDPRILLDHKWKGKRKTGEPGYEPGSTSWGWDFADQFPPVVVEYLKKGEEIIGEHKFGYDEQRNTIYARKVRQK